MKLYPFLILTSLVLSACVQAPVFKGDDYAYIASNYPIVSVNGVQVDPVYKLDFKAGMNTLVIVYHTYRYDYLCTFQWHADSGVAYEVTNQNHKYPLTLYRWKPNNKYWVSRHDPVAPLQCIQNQK